MMSYYYVKADLPGVPAGSVERFAYVKAAGLVDQGAIELFDVHNKRHTKAKTEQEERFARRKALIERALEAERKIRAAREGRG